MATTKPRVTITLEPEHYAVLVEMAEVTGSSMSSIVADVVAEAAPVFLRVVKLIREAEAVKGSLGDRVRELATEAELEMMPLAREALKNLDMFDDQVMKAIADAKNAAKGSDGAGVPSDRSVPSPKRKGKRA